jgi:hypothetical protein
VTPIGGEELPRGARPGEKVLQRPDLGWGIGHRVECDSTAVGVHLQRADPPHRDANAFSRTAPEWHAPDAIGPLCGSLREFCTRCAPHSGPRRAKRAKRYWQPAKGRCGDIKGRSPLAGLWPDGEQKASVRRPRQPQAIGALARRRRSGETNHLTWLSASGRRHHKRLGSDVRNLRTVGRDRERQSASTIRSI